MVEGGRVYKGVCNRAYEHLPATILSTFDVAGLSEIAVSPSTRAIKRRQYRYWTILRLLVPPPKLVLLPKLFRLPKLGFLFIFEEDPVDTPPAAFSLSFSTKNFSKAK